MWLGARKSESETLPAPLLMLILCQATPLNSPVPPPPVIKTGGAQLSLWSAASQHSLMVMSPSSAVKEKRKRKKKTVNGFSVPRPSPTPHPIYFWKNAGADWAMISWRELCFPLNITSPRLICISQGGAEGKGSQQSAGENPSVCVLYSPLRWMLIRSSCVRLSRADAPFLEVCSYACLWCALMRKLTFVDWSSQLKLKRASRAPTHSCSQQLLRHPFGTREPFTRVYICSNVFCAGTNLQPPAVSY